VVDIADIFEFLASQMADAEAHWSLGTFGAIAEFVRNPDEPVAFSRTGNSVSAVTARGGIRIEPPADTRPIASETATRESWNHRIALCLRDDRCAMGRRAVLTELGPDVGALREQDQKAVLFDLGLDTLQADLCVRVSDPNVLAQLRAHTGRALFDPANPVMAVILAASPHRVFVSRLGRIEVFQTIPSPNDKSPEGPHTHVLPKLLTHRRTHAATESIPEGWIPCAHLYPAHPVKDRFGRSRPFDAARHHAFQGMMQMFGDPQLVALKQRVIAATAAGKNPAVVAISNNRFARTNVRVALRQLEASSGPSPSLLAWTAAYERPLPIEVEPEEPVDQCGHQS